MMSVFHEAYRFSPVNYANAIAQILPARQESLSAMHDRLRYQALELARCNVMTKQLMNTFGGWNVDAVSELLLEKGALSADDVSFCLTLILFSHLTHVHSDAQCGLGLLSRSCAAVLKRGGWSFSESTFLVKGHDFGEFFDRFIGNGIDHPAVTAGLRASFAHLRPASVASCAGWLDASEVDAYRIKFEKCADHFHQVVASPDEERALELLDTMLSLTCSSSSGLCLMVSG